MLTLALLFGFFLLCSSSAFSVESQLPSFSWLRNSQTQGGNDLSLKIRFPDGDHDVIRFQKTQMLDDEVDDCIMSGAFVKDPDVRVTVTGSCGNSEDYEITIVGAERLRQSTFKVSNGKVEPTKSNHRCLGNADPFYDRAQLPKQEENRLQRLPRYVWLKIELYADTEFRNYFSSDEKKIKNTITKIVGHAQTWFSQKNLVPEIILQASFLPYWKYNDSIYLDGIQNPDFVKASSWVNEMRNINKSQDEKPISINNSVMVFFSKRGYFQSATGVAMLGSICSNQELPKVSLAIEHWFYTAVTAKSLAHEIAHILGIPHDFHDGGKYRKDKNGRSCYTYGSIMDYSSHFSTWSTCSIEALEELLKSGKLSCLEMRYND